MIYEKEKIRILRKRIHFFKLMKISCKAESMIFIGYNNHYRFRKSFFWVLIGKRLLGFLRNFFVHLYLFISYVFKHFSSSGLNVEVIVSNLRHSEAQLSTFFLSNEVPKYISIPQFDTFNYNNSYLSCVIYD